MAEKVGLTNLISINKPTLVRLKWGQTEYKGRLVSVDSYMNIQLGETEEFIDGKSTGSLGMVLIRSVPRCSARSFCRSGLAHPSFQLRQGTGRG